MLSRRDLLKRSGMGFAGLSLAGMLAEQAGTGVAQAASSPMAPRIPQFAAKAKHVIHIFCNGGPSHVDTFDPKPKLLEYAGKTLPTENLRTERKSIGSWRARS